jgi:hypothetical protein
MRPVAPASVASVDCVRRDETYPPIDAVFPKEHKASAVINRDRLIESLKRVSPLASDTRGVTITPSDGGLTLVTVDLDGGERVHLLCGLNALHGRRYRRGARRDGMPITDPGAPDSAIERTTLWCDCSCTPGIHASR